MAPGTKRTRSAGLLPPSSVPLDRSPLKDARTAQRVAAQRRSASHDTRASSTHDAVDPMDVLRTPRTPSPPPARVRRNEEGDESMDPLMLSPTPEERIGRKRVSPVLEDMDTDVPQEDGRSREAKRARTDNGVTLLDASTQPRPPTEKHIDLAALTSKPFPRTRPRSRSRPLIASPNKAVSPTRAHSVPTLAQQPVSALERKEELPVPHIDLRAVPPSPWRSSPTKKLMHLASVPPRVLVEEEGEERGRRLEPTRQRARSKSTAGRDKSRPPSSPPITTMPQTPALARGPSRPVSRAPSRAPSPPRSPGSNAVDKPTLAESAISMTSTTTPLPPRSSEPSSPMSPLTLLPARTPLFARARLRPHPPPTPEDESAAPLGAFDFPASDEAEPRALSPAPASAPANEAPETLKIGPPRDKPRQTPSSSSTRVPGVSDAGTYKTPVQQETKAQPTKSALVIDVPPALQKRGFANRMKAKDGSAREVDAVPATAAGPSGKVATAKAGAGKVQVRAKTPGLSATGIAKVPPRSKTPASVAEPTPVANGVIKGSQRSKTPAPAPEPVPSIEASAESTPAVNDAGKAPPSKTPAPASDTTSTTEPMVKTAPKMSKPPPPTAKPPSMLGKSATLVPPHGKLPAKTAAAKPSEALAKKAPALARPPMARRVTRSSSGKAEIEAQRQVQSQGIKGKGREKEKEIEAEVVKGGNEVLQGDSREQLKAEVVVPLQSGAEEKEIQRSQGDLPAPPMDVENDYPLVPDTMAEEAMDVDIPAQEPEPPIEHDILVPLVDSVNEDSVGLGSSTDSHGPTKRMPRKSFAAPTSSSLAKSRSKSRPSSPVRGEASDHARHRTNSNTSETESVPTRGRQPFKSPAPPSSKPRPRASSAFPSTSKTTTTPSTVGPSSSKVAPKATITSFFQSKTKQGAVPETPAPAVAASETEDEDKRPKTLSTLERALERLAAPPPTKRESTRANTSLGFNGDAPTSDEEMTTPSVYKSAVAQRARSKSRGPAARVGASASDTEFKPSLKRTAADAALPSQKPVSSVGAHKRRDPIGTPLERSASVPPIQSVASTSTLASTSSAGSSVSVRGKQSTLVGKASPFGVGPSQPFGHSLRGNGRRVMSTGRMATGIMGGRTATKASKQTPLAMIEGSPVKPVHDVVPQGDDMIDLDDPAEAATSVGRRPAAPLPRLPFGERRFPSASDTEEDVFIPTAPDPKSKVRDHDHYKNASRRVSLASQLLAQSLEELPQTPVGNSSKGNSASPGEMGPPRVPPSTGMRTRQAAAGGHVSKRASESGTPEPTPQAGRKGQAKGPSLGVLDGAVIFVDVRTDDGDDAGSLFSEMLQGLGGRLVTRVGPTCTHIVFKNGLMSTVTRWRILNDPKPYVVGIGWVVACAEQRIKVDEAKFKVDFDDFNLAGTHKRRRSMLPKHIFAPTDGPSGSSNPPVAASTDGDSAVSMSEDDSLPPLERARRRKSLAMPQ